MPPPGLYCGSLGRASRDMAETQIVASLAAIEQKVWESERDRRLPGYEVAVRALIDAVHAMLVGPVSSNVLSTMRTESGLLALDN